MLQRQGRRRDGSDSVGKQKLAQTAELRPDACSLELWINWNTKTVCTAAQTLQTTSSNTTEDSIVVAKKSCKEKLNRLFSPSNHHPQRTSGLIRRWTQRTTEGRRIEKFILGDVAVAAAQQHYYVKSVLSRVSMGAYSLLNI